MQAKLLTVLRNFQKTILDILFPITCISCGKEGKWLCDDCISNVFIRDEHVCGVCEKRNTPDGKTCLSCKRKSALSAFVVATSYANSFVAKAVHVYKYRFIADLHIPLGNLIIRTLQKTELPIADVIIPIPLHPRRLRWRGFNQATLLARHVAQNLLPGTQIDLEEKNLIRKKYTHPQMKINDRQARKQNMHKAFCVTNPEKIKNKTILLIDDIATTGSTIFECARVLKEAGAKEILAAVIARQEARS